MGYVSLTEQGKSFIKNVCSGNGNSLLSGKNSYVLPHCSPECPSSKIWTSNAKHNGVPITSNYELGEAIIDWYNKYGEIFDIDANIMAAQAYQESGYKIWNYPPNSTASGISQFIVETIFEIIVKNKYLKDSKYEFTNGEISAITNNLNGNKELISSYKINENIGRKNRMTLHQNVIDNPEIMVKAQCYYMKYIGMRCNNLASSALFGYNRGHKYALPSYTKSIISATKSNNYQMEGIDYVYKIFNLLGNKNFNRYGYFGYDHLELDKPFSEYMAECAESDNYS